MIASGPMPRSPVWLRKIPSTVSGSQGSRRGLRPAVRFAFPLGARLNITLRARPCQELFSESFCRPSRGPRGASRLRGLCPSRRRVRYYTLPRRGAGGKPSRTQDADNSGAVKRGDAGQEVGPDLALRPGPDAGPSRGPGASPRLIHRRNRTKGPRRASAGPSGAADSAARIQPPIYRQGDLCPPSGREPPAFVMQAALPPIAGFPLFAFAEPLAERMPARAAWPRCAARASRKRKTAASGPARLPRGPPLSDRPWSIIYVGGFPSFRY